MKKFAIAIFLKLAMFTSGNIRAQSTGNVAITNIGCHNHDDTCFVEIAGPAVGPESCKSNSIRWRRTADANGEATFSMITAAYFAGNKVRITTSGSCFSRQPNYPTIAYMSVVKN
ncbi:hypothetical protein FLL45_00340 [Aliikangiella marina]|uniref:Uncharacterized protein n=1 Tax=Aliikangiella marina TaxID=1712262 RepID=A0A545TGT6_9GAMM|nr:hypothetical protein [Aliikangiella marina]TQV76450.1 hypothetical protein FLL45_00340 [Aliikangiella marina]